MLYSTQFLALMGTTPPAPPPVATTITIAPNNPGNLGTPPQNWTTQVSAPTLTQVKWRVGVPGSKTIAFPCDAPDNPTVAGYNHGDTINFTGYGTGFTFTKTDVGPNSFYASGSNGFDNFTIPGETRLQDVRYTVDGVGGTGPATFTLLNLTAGAGTIVAPFSIAGDRLIVANMTETVVTQSGQVIFSATPTRSITMTPSVVGNMTVPPQNFTTTINAVGMTQVKWVVMSATWTFVGSTTWNVVDLVNNSATITCTFTGDGQRLLVESIDEIIEAVSTQVTFTGAVRSLSISPTAPGDLGTAPKTWTTTATAPGQSQVKWAVFNSDNTSVGAWTVVNVGAGNTVAITCNFTTPGQRLQVQSMDDTLQATSTQVSFNSAPPVISDDLAFARAFLAPLTLGLNIERDTSLGRTQSYYTNLKNACDGNFIRFFMPRKPSFGGWGSDAQVNAFLDTCQNAMAAGWSVLLACSDVVEPADVQDGGALGHQQRCGNLIAARNLDPRRFMVNPINEWAYMTNQFYQPFREAFHNALRQRLPNHVICTSAADWGNSSALTNGTFAVLQDKRVLYEWHEYPWNAETLGNATTIQNRLNTWRTANNVVTFCGEYGKNQQESLGNPGVDPSWIPAVVDAAARGIGRERPMFWTITNGGWWRMNNSSNLDLRPEIATAMRAGAAHIRAQSYYGT